MRKRVGLLSMAAAMVGLGASAQSATNSVKEYKSRPGLSDAP